MNKPKNEVIFVHQNLIPNRSTYLVHTKSTGELISFGFSDRSDRSLVSAKRSANRWDQTKKRLHFLAYLWSQSEFRTRRKSQWTTDPQSEMTRWLCYKWMCFLLQLCVNTFHTEFSMYSVCATASTQCYFDTFHSEFSMYSVCATASTVLLWYVSQWILDVLCVCYSQYSVTLIRFTLNSRCTLCVLQPVQCYFDMFHTEFSMRFTLNSRCTLCVLQPVQCYIVLIKGCLLT